MSYYTKRIEKRICEFCGAEVEIHIQKRDLHAPLRNGEADERIVDMGCSCFFGSLVKQEEKKIIKAMCQNCYYNKCGECINEKTKEQVSEMFNVDKLVIKNVKKKCKNFKLNTDIFAGIYKVK